MVSLMNYIWIIGKTVIIYFVIIFILRILGKREVGQLSIFDLVILLIIADIASIGIDNDEFFWASFCCLAVLAILQKLLSLILLHVAKLRKLFDGDPTIIVYNGVIKLKNMKKELYTMDDLVCQMRLENVMDISQIKLAILETNGTLSIIQKNESYNTILPIILSGELVMDNIKCLNYDINKIKKALSKHKLQLKKILYASIHHNTLTYYYHNKNKGEINAQSITLN